MGRTVSLFLMRAFGMLLAGMLLFAVFVPAHAQTDGSYGLKRFPGDNYDSVPPGAGIPAPHFKAASLGSKRRRVNL